MIYSYLSSLFGTFLIGHWVPLNYSIELYIYILFYLIITEPWTICALHHFCTWALTTVANSVSLNFPFIIFDLALIEAILFFRLIFCLVLHFTFLIADSIFLYRRATFDIFFQPGLTFILSILFFRSLLISLQPNFWLDYLMNFFIVGVGLFSSSHL